MDRPQDQYSSPRRELQGPRPTPLKVRKESHKIRKPPVAPQPSGPLPARPPVIIYAVSPKVIHTSPSGFMSLVQRLTGPGPATTNNLPSHASSATSFFNGGADILSPAARLAMMEKMKMPLEGKGYNMVVGDTGGFDFSDIRIGDGFIQSILSPGPAGLTRPVPDSFFLPISDPSPLVNLYHQQTSFLHQDYFNALHQQLQDGGGGIGGAGGSGGGSSGLLPSPMLSPASIEFLRKLLEQ